MAAYRRLPLSRSQRVRSRRTWRWRPRASPRCPVNWARLLSVLAMPWRSPTARCSARLSASRAQAVLQVATLPDDGAQVVQRARHVRVIAEVPETLQPARHADSMARLVISLVVRDRAQVVQGRGNAGFRSACSATARFSSSSAWSLLQVPWLSLTTPRLLRSRPRRADHPTPGRDAGFRCAGAPPPSISGAIRQHARAIERLRPQVLSRTGNFRQQ